MFMLLHPVCTSWKLNKYNIKAFSRKKKKKKKIMTGVLELQPELISAHWASGTK